MQEACMHVFSTMDGGLLCSFFFLSKFNAFKVTSNIKFVWGGERHCKSGVSCPRAQHFPRIGYSCVFLKLPCTDF